MVVVCLHQFLLKLMWTFSLSYSQTLFPASTKIQSNQGNLTSNERNKGETDKSNNKTYTKEAEGVRINKEVEAEETKEHRRRYSQKGGTAPNKDCMQTEKNTMATNNGTVDKPYARGRKEHQARGIDKEEGQVEVRRGRSRLAEGQRKKEGKEEKKRSSSRRGSRDKDRTSRAKVQEKVSNKIEGRNSDKEREKTDDGSLMTTATSLAKSVMGILIIDNDTRKEKQKATTIKVKKEMAEEDGRYSGITTEKQNKEAEKRSEQKKSEIVDLTKTPTKRKNDDTKGTGSGKSTGGNDKKKKRQQQLTFTPKRVTMERGNENHQEKEELQRKRENENENNKKSSENKKKQTRSPGRNATKTESNTPQTKNNTDAENKRNQTDENNETEAITPPEINRTTKRPPYIHEKKQEANSYTTKEAEEKIQKMRTENETPSVNGTETTSNETSTPRSTNSKPVSYAEVTSGTQSKLINQEKKRGKHNRRFEISFVIEDPKQQKKECELTNLRNTITAILKRAQKVDKNSMINTWHDQRKMRTIEKIEDIPFTPNDMKMYLNHPYKDREIKKKNNGWRINLSFSIPYDLFLHYWEKSKREYTEVPFVMLRDAPIQHERYYNSGTLLNSSDGQLTDQLCKQLTEEIGVEINCSFRPAPLDKEAADGFWKKAYEKANTGRRNLFRFAPMAMNVYAKTPEDARTAANQLLSKYGKQTKEGQYPRMPDGSRMRFIPANRFLDMAGKETAKNLFENQINFNVNHIKLPLPLRSIDKTYDEHDGKSIMELLLDMKCERKENEPYFRHVTKMWTRNFTEKKWMVSVHKEMLQEAQSMIGKLKEELGKRYGEAVALEVIEHDEHEEASTYSKETSNYTASTLTLDTNDRYLNGPARFIIEGMETLSTIEVPSLAVQRAKESDNYSMEVATTGTDNSKESMATMKEGTINYSDKEQKQTSTEKSIQEEKDKERETKQIPRERKNETWERVGDENAERQLQRQITNITNHDPGGKPGDNSF